jgi:hypothetical protein
MPLPVPKGMSITRAKEAVLDLFAKGVTVEVAMAAVGRTQKTYENWRASDEDFKNKVDQIRGVRASAKKRGG